MLLTMPIWSMPPCLKAFLTGAFATPITCLETRYFLTEKQSELVLRRTVLEKSVGVFCCTTDF